MQSLTLSDYPVLTRTRPAHNVSDKYATLPTIDVLERASQHGLVPVRIDMPRVRHGVQGYEPHMVALQHPDYRGDYVPELLLYNSMDGKRAWRLYSGLFRFVCTNGLVIGSSVQQYRVIHAGDLTDVRALVDKYLAASLANISDTLQIAERMRARQLTRADQVSFAREAISARWPDRDGRPIRPDLVLESRREEDTGSDVWTVFNRIQENIVRPRPSSGMGVRLTNISRSLDINQTLWDTALRYVG
jgi:hypothetical protein